jgi:hypothetical protein
MINNKKFALKSFSIGWPVHPNQGKGHFSLVQAHHPNPYGK